MRYTTNDLKKKVAQPDKKMKKLRESFSLSSLLVLLNNHIYTKLLSFPLGSSVFLFFFFHSKHQSNTHTHQTLMLIPF